MTSETKHMKLSLDKIARSHYELSEEQPILCSRNVHPERYKLRWDMHYGLEFGLLYSGQESRFFINNFKIPARPGDVWFCGMWEPHGMQVDRIPCETIVFKIWPPFLAQMYFPEAPGFHPLAPFIAPPEQRPRSSSHQLKKTMLKFGRSIKEILLSTTSFRAINLRFVVLEMLLQLYQSWPYAAIQSRRAPPAEVSRINRAIQKVFDSRAFVSTGEAARLCGMNRHSFSTLFESWMNVRFNDFAVKHRLYQAALQLRDTREPIKLIASQWGFADISHFYRMFIKYFGFSPSEYRDQLLDFKGGRRMPGGPLVTRKRLVGK